MLKNTYIFLILFGLSSFVYSKGSEKQYFICEGYKSHGQLPTNSEKKMEEVERTRKVKESMVFQRIQKTTSKSKLTDPNGYLIFPNETLEVCWEDQVNLGLVKNCDLRNVVIHKRSKHSGTMDKITGKLHYSGQYEINDIFYWKDYNLDCKRIDSPVVR